MAEKKLLEVRTQVKKRKPTFRRVQANQFAKLNNKGASWRKPKGMGNKVRRQRRGQAKMPKVGYGSPVAVKGLNKAGFEEVLVYNLADLESIDKKTQVAVIGSTVGGKKRIEILTKAQELKVEVANYKNSQEAIKALTKEKKVETKKKAPAKKADAKTTKKATAKKEEAKK